MLARLGHVPEWTANAIVSFSILLTDELAKETRLWIIGVLLVFAGVVFLIGRALRYIFAGFTVTLS
jgi:hypothetical protein